LSSAFLASLAGDAQTPTLSNPVLSSEFSTTLSGYVLCSPLPPVLSSYAFFLTLRIVFNHQSFQIIFFRHLLAVLVGISRGWKRPPAACDLLTESIYLFLL
jgi:hypothetical protein